MTFRDIRRDFSRLLKIFDKTLEVFARLYSLFVTLMIFMTFEEFWRLLEAIEGSWRLEVASRGYKY